MSLLLQEDYSHRPQVTAGNWRRSDTFYGLRGMLPAKTQREYGTVVPLEWMWSYSGDIIFDRIGIVASGEI